MKYAWIESQRGSYGVTLMCELLGVSRSGLHAPFTMKKVILVRAAYALKSRFERLREQGMLTGEEVAQQLGVSTTTVHQLGRQGILSRQLYGNNHRCLYDPPGAVTLIKGTGSRYGGRPPRLTPAQRSA